MTKHDTAAIRKLARKLESIADKLSGTDHDAVKRIAGMNDEMLGDTHNAISEVTERMSTELQSIRNGLARNAAALYQYAHELDIADAMAQSLISSK